MKQKLFAVGLLLALSALTVGRLMSPTSGEARMTLYQRRPWPAMHPGAEKGRKASKAWSRGRP